MGASVFITAAELLCTWGRDATWINSSERKKQPLNAVLEIVPIMIPPRKKSFRIDDGNSWERQTFLSHVFPECQLGVSDVSANFPRLQESVTQRTPHALPRTQTSLSRWKRARKERSAQARSVINRTLKQKVFLFALPLNYFALPWVSPWVPWALFLERMVKLACPQTFYFLLKVRRARVIKHKPQGIYWPKRTKRKIKQRLCTGYG